MTLLRAFFQYFFCLLQHENQTCLEQIPADAIRRNIHTGLSTIEGYFKDRISEVSAKQSGNLNYI